MGKGMRTKEEIAAGLGQVLLLLLAFWAVRPGPTRNDYLLSASLFGLSLLPIGFTFRLGWLRAVALAWWVMFLILSWQHGSRGGIGDEVGVLGRLAFLLAAFAAAAGQCLHLDQVQLGRVGAVARGISKVLIGLCVLLLLAFLQGGAGLEVALALLFGTLADLAFTALTYLLAALVAVRQAKGLQAQ
jgi:hypothetical protein